MTKFRKRVLLFISVGMILLLGGCDQNKHNDFISSVIEKNVNPLDFSFDGVKIFSNNNRNCFSYILNNVPDMMKIFETALNRDGISIYKEDDGIIIDVEAYIAKKLQDNGIDESSAVLYNSHISDVQCRKIDDIVYFVDREGKYIRGAAYILLSENDELMQELDKYAMGEYIRMLDEEVVAKVNNVAEIHLVQNVIEAFGVSIEYGAGSVRIIRDMEKENVVGCSNHIYDMMRQYAGDGWNLEYCGSNSACDSVVYKVKMSREILSDEGNLEEKLENEMYLYVYGKDGIVREIKYEADSNDLPEVAKATVRNYLIDMGMSETEAEDFIKTLPEKDGTIGELKYYVENNSRLYSNDYVLKVSR